MKAENGNLFNYKAFTANDYDTSNFWDNEAQKSTELKVAYNNPVLADLDGMGAGAFCVMSGNTLNDDNNYGVFSLDSEVEISLLPSKEIQTDIPDLWKEVEKDTGLGAGTLTGTCLASSSLKDEKLVALVKKHFNAITFENELKPESLMNGIYPKGGFKEDDLVEFK